jgi:hypothetical protein
MRKSAQRRYKMQKYYFKQTEAVANATEVADWLAENASEYFDSFEVDTTSNGSYGTSHPLVACKINDVVVLAFAASNPGGLSSAVTKVKTLQLSTLGGKTAGPFGVQNSDSVHTYAHTVYAIKTDYGIMLYFSDDYSIFVTKSDAGTTAIHAEWYYQVGGTEFYKYYTVDVVNDPAISVFTADTVQQSSLTSLCPIVFTGGTYAPNMFVTPYTQHKGTTGHINVAGVGYLYNGYVALKC